MAHEELTWPNAQEMKDKYTKLMNDLNAQRPAINTAANSVVPTAGFTGGALTGDYYDAYDQHAALWIQEAQGLVADFSTFLSELDVRIANAGTEEALWQSRIGVTHTVADPWD